jgi:hypothetical protein
MRDRFYQENRVAGPIFIAANFIAANFIAAWPAGRDRHIGV